MSLLRDFGVFFHLCKPLPAPEPTIIAQMQTRMADAWRAYQAHQAQAEHYAAQAEGAMRQYRRIAAEIKEGAWQS